MEYNTMFIIIVNYKIDLSVVERHLPAHVEFLKANYSLGNICASGRQVPRTGGIIMSELKNRAEVERVLSADPFNINGVADYQIIEFAPSMASERWKEVMGV